MKNKIKLLEMDVIHNTNETIPNFSLERAIQTPRPFKCDNKSCPYNDQCDFCSSPSIVSINKFGECSIWANLQKSFKTGI